MSRGGDWIPHTSVVMGCLIAFAMAMGAIFVDCYQRVRKSYSNVPLQLFSSGPFLLLALICAMIAGVAYLMTDPDGNSYIDKLLTLSIKDPYLRAVYVGMLVLVIIRSKIFQIQNADFGGEFFYNLGREKAINSIILRWIIWRDGFLARILPQTYKVKDYDKAMFERMKAIAVQSSDPDYRANIDSQIKEIERAKPSTNQDPNDDQWQLYYKTITRMALDVCGRGAFKEFS